MEHNKELEKFLKDEILFMNEAFSTCLMDMLRNIKIPLERAVTFTWKDPSTLPSARSANRKSCKVLMDQRNSRERNNEAVKKTRAKQNIYQKNLMEHIEELEDALMSLRNIAPSPRYPD